MPKNVQTTAQLYSSHTLAQNSLSQASTVCELWTSRCSSWIYKRQRNQRSNCQHPLDHQKSKRVPEKHLLLLYWPCQSLWLCGSQQTVENSETDGNIRPPYLPSKKSVCRSRSNRTGHGTTHWFQTGKGVHQGYILSPCLFNLYAEYIMGNAGLDEA